MITTFQALLGTAIAILPGSAYTIARESRAASWAWRSTDAATFVFRFLTASATQFLNGDHRLRISRRFIWDNSR